MSPSSHQLWLQELGFLEYAVFHGGDFSETILTPQRIETAFEVNSDAKWSFDSHEMQNPQDPAPCCAYRQLNKTTGQ